jgi:two-component system, chemotaxis family, response regulator PixH
MQRVLIVDDDEAARNVIKECLSGTYEVIDTGVPETALAMVLEHKPEAILLNLSMPGMSGLELCQALSSLSFTQQIPIFITGEDERNKAFCQSFGASRYFRRPIDFDKLKTDLASVLSSKKPERRTNVRVRLRVILKLRGTDKDGALLEARAVTEDVSEGGFLCACVLLLEEGTTFDVFLDGERESYLGHARLARVVKTQSLSSRYAFQFVRPVAAISEEEQRALATRFT